jgi:hypothetical protein
MSYSTANCAFQATLLSLTAKLEDLVMNTQQALAAAFGEAISSSRQIQEKSAQNIATILSTSFDATMSMVRNI